MDGTTSVREITATRQNAPPRSRLHLCALVDGQNICTGCPMYPPTPWTECPERRRAVEYLQWNVDGYALGATSDRRGGDVHVRARNGAQPWLVLTINDPLHDPTCTWSPEWWPGAPGEDLRRAVVRQVLQAVRAHHAVECDG